jgi:hypothetical protein
MKHFSTFLLKLMLVFLLLGCMFSSLHAQITQATFYSAADLSLGSGTGGDIGDAKTRNFGGGGSIMVTNYDDFPGYMSPFEGWVKFDLTTLGDSIPDGQGILYAELFYKVSANTGNGFQCFHLKDIDDWKEGNGSSGSLDDTGEGLTWTDAQAFDYENPDNYTLIYTDPNVGGTSYVGSFNVKLAADYEMGAEGNQIMTLRFYPTIDDPEDNKKWLGLYAREAPWGAIDAESGIALDAPHIIFYIGEPQPTQFSEIENFGDIGNYNITPTGFQKWAVVEDEGDARLMITERPAPINGTPGGLAIFNMDNYGDFDISLQAKLNKLSGGALDPKADFIVAFGYEGPLDYSYMRFTGENINGLYKVDTTGGGAVTEVGDLNTNPAITDTMYHDYRLVRSGTTMTAYVDDVEYLSVTDDALGTEGMIGMGSYNDIALFDDFMEGAEGPQSVDGLNQMSFSLYPNPVQDKLYVKADYRIQKLLITNLIGQRLMEVKIMKSGVTQINTSQLESGIYFMTVHASNGHYHSQKFIVR